MGTELFDSLRAPLLFNALQQYWRIGGVCFLGGKLQNAPAKKGFREVDGDKGEPRGFQTSFPVTTAHCPERNRAL